MIYAIGKVVGKHNGHNRVVMETCDEAQFVGSVWMNDQTLTDGKAYLFRFDPQDQFCFASALPKGGMA